MSDSPERVYPMLLDFVRKEAISKNLLRVTLTGEDLIGFPEDQNGSHIKVFFPNQASGILQLPVREGENVIWPEHKPVPRAYSVRQYRAAVNELDIDFVTHGEETPGGGWALKAGIGSQIGLIGPAGPDPLIEPADWHIIAGDLSAVPAMSAILEKLPSDAKGYVFIEVDEIEDIHDLVHPEGMAINWLMRNPHDAEPALAKAIQQLPAPEKATSLSAFIAGENQSVISCRKILRNDYQIARDKLYAIPYWKRGKAEEAYHDERHDVMDAAY
ncbi:siderophore-interacting protein [Vibrio vulnificus]|nr:siderophore-interacting protein [Vibrio vulnificus]